MRDNTNLWKSEVFDTRGKTRKRVKINNSIQKQDLVSALCFFFVSLFHFVTEHKYDLQYRSKVWTHLYTAVIHKKDKNI